ncbi:MAG: GNAT family N-acetyltransferase [Proteobacteria bacterium]|nr:MAG: GNAT family N-acetyltransferase [Pseudomonadota bacterium]
MSAPLQLVGPEEELEESYLSFIADMKDRGEKIWEAFLPRPGESFSDFVNHLKSAESSPEPGQVMTTTYWAMLGEVVVGRISIRHELTDDLRDFGGHIGYEVRPTARKKGVATEMLRLALRTPAARKIEKVLLTCAPDNIASNRTIQKNGGLLAGSKFVARVQRQTNYYWIDVSAREPCS